MNTEEIIIDLDAGRVMIHDIITEQADRFDFEEGVATRDALQALIKEAGDAVSLLETTMLGQLETGVRQIGNRLFKRKRLVVERFRHDLIKAWVSTYARTSASDTETGEISATRAVDIAVQAMDRLYVSPSTKAKIGVLDSLGIQRRDVSESEDKGFRLEVEELDARQD